VTLDPLAGHVVVLAGSAARAGIELMSRGVLLAAVTDDRDVVDELERTAAEHPETMLLSYCTDPTDPAVWQRVAAHIEQRVGPVDAVLCAADDADLLEATFGDDLRRRGHGAVIVLSAGMDPAAALHRHLRRTP
jgi:NAD(P)-dependent dehydrogenase (short-subunit alcohol dehydrogenase family)